jgi:hypothetical protein
MAHHEKPAAAVIVPAGPAGLFSLQTIDNGQQAK